MSQSPDPVPATNAAHPISLLPETPAAFPASGFSVSDWRPKFSARRHRAPGAGALDRDGGRRIRQTQRLSQVAIGNQNRRQALRRNSLPRPYCRSPEPCARLLRSRSSSRGRGGSIPDPPRVVMMTWSERSAEPRPIEVGTGKFRSPQAGDPTAKDPSSISFTTIKSHSGRKVGDPRIRGSCVEDSCRTAGAGSLERGRPCRGWDLKLRDDHIAVLDRQRGVFNSEACVRPGDHHDAVFTAGHGDHGRARWECRRRFEPVPVSTPA